MNRRLVAIRNFLILGAIAALGLVWSDGLGASAIAVNQIFLVVFLAFLVLMGYRYFHENRFKWLVIKPVLRGVIIACAVGIVILVAAGPTLFADAISTAGIWALVVGARARDRLDRLPEPPLLAPRFENWHGVRA